MIVTIMQPAYLPWLGYFARIAAADLFIVLDHVAIDRNSKTKFANRNRIRTAQGWTWLTVPIRTTGRSNELALNEIEIDDDPSWRRRHWRSIEMNYRRAPFFEAHREPLAALYEAPWCRLLDVDLAAAQLLLDAFGIATPFMSSASMAIGSRKSELILDLCRAVGATRYISGPFGREYLDESRFRSAGIDLNIHDYCHPTYRQCFPGFEPFMSALDLLLNCGPDSLGILADLPVRRMH